MGKPRAARKQPIVISEEDEDYSPPPKRPKRGTLHSTSQNGSSKQKQNHPTSSPKQVPSLSSQKSPSKSPSKIKHIGKPITAFFSNVPRKQTPQPTPSPEKQISDTQVDEEDEILDSSDDRRMSRLSGNPGSITAFAVRKRRRERFGVEADGPPKGSQKFLKTANGNRSTPPLSATASLLVEKDQRPWNEKYGPTSVEELAVHKKKVGDVRTWLSDVFAGRDRKRLLLLKGPAGSGKTTTISLLSKELRFEIQEWKNPNTSSYSSEGFVSITAQFDDFVGRTERFGSLTFDSRSHTSQTDLTPKTSDRQKQLILVEEFPNTFTRSSSSVQSFRSSVLHFLAANAPSAGAFFTGQRDSSQPVTPIVMVVSETLLSTSTAAADSFTAHRLLGPDILNHPGVSVIEFNSIAPTFMTKALEMVVLKEARKSGRKKTVGPQVLKRLSEIGDVRSAVSSLEFLCVRGDDYEGWDSRITFTKPKKGLRDTPLTKMEQESLEMVTQRESTLGIFHAVGRVVHNKRLPDDASNAIQQPPNWFPERRRPKASEVQVDTLIDELGTDIQTFIASLHENYVLSCEGPDSEDTIDSINGCIDALSDADLLSTDRFHARGFGRRIFQGTSADNLRQEELSFQVGVRGLLYSLPHPVKRVAPPQGTPNRRGSTTSKGSAFQMYWPASLRIWRPQEEIEGLLEMWVSRAQRGELLSTSATKPNAQVANPGSVESWRRSSAPTHSSQSSTSKEETSAPVLLGSGTSARSEMLLERLPYLPIILRKSRMPSPSIASTIREIQKITSFTGIGTTTNEEEGDEDEESVEQEQWSTDAPNERKQKKRRQKIENKGGMESALPGLVEKDVERLVLSDDDIEDA